MYFNDYFIGFKETDVINMGGSTSVRNMNCDTVEAEQVIYHNGNDVTLISGFEDCGEYHCAFADHAMVFIACGIHRKCIGAIE